jgi:hypothetical protein
LALGGYAERTAAPNHPKSPLFLSTAPQSEIPGISKKIRGTPYWKRGYKWGIRNVWKIFHLILCLIERR